MVIPIGYESKRMCCSKKIIVVSYTVTILLTLLCVYGCLLTGRDMTPLVTLTGLAWAETTSANAFYFWKAKAENRIKLINSMVQSLGDKYGIDAVVQLAEIILPRD